MPDVNNFEKYPLGYSLKKNISDLKELTGETSDLLINEVNISGLDCCLLCFEGMVSTSTITELVLHPLMYLEIGNVTAEKLYSHIKGKMLLTVDRSETADFGSLCRFLMSGFALILIDGVNKALALGVQGYAVRGISEPSGEENIKGSHEGFTEQVRTNMSLIRRRIKSPTLRFELYPIGQRSKTDICIAYLSDKCPESLISELKRRLDGIKTETVLTTGYLKPFISRHIRSPFTSAGLTERPDAVCGKLLEGRAAVIVDGTPFVIVLPWLFSENFQTIDDYADRPYFSSYLRLVRMLAFVLSVLLPAVYVAAAVFHPELFNISLLLSLSAAEQTAPFSLLSEAVIMLLAYEIIKEAGLRLPKAVGGAVSIVGGLIIGDAAVSAGLVSMPLLLVIALSVTASYVSPNISAEGTMLRFFCLLLGGFFGLFGVGIGVCLTIVNLVSVKDYGVYIAAPIEPFKLSALSDVFWRRSFKRPHNSTVEELSDE